MTKDKSGCKYCDAGSPVHYWNPHDDGGYRRMHRGYDEDGEYTSNFCQIDPTLSERHPFIFWALIISIVVYGGMFISMYFGATP